MYRRIFFLLIAWLLMIPAAPMSAQAPDGYPVPHPSEMGLMGERPFDDFDVPQAQPQSRMVDAADAVVQAGKTYTWTLDTRAEWLQGTLANLDAATLSGTLRLAVQRWFGESVSVTPEDQLAVDQESPSLAVGTDGTLYAVWEDRRNGDYDIYFAKSTDGGATWGGIRAGERFFFLGFLVVKPLPDGGSGWRALRRVAG